MKTPHLLAAIGASAALFAPLRPALAAGPGVPGLDSVIDWRERHNRDDDPKPSDVQLINYFFVRATFTNQLADPSGLKGVSLGPFGLISGSATRTGEGSKTFYVEQRWIPVISYSPSFADGIATFRAQLEIDFTWGLAANQVQPNQGGGFNADQINIQTKNVNVSITPTRDPDQLNIILGTQSFYDSAYDPTVTSLFDIVRTGYKLTFLGTDATGVAAYFEVRRALQAELHPHRIGAARQGLEERRALRLRVPLHRRLRLQALARDVPRRLVLAPAGRHQGRGVRLRGPRQIGPVVDRPRLVHGHGALQHG
ncbi:MAG: hypothetical protein QM820_52835 [Minicystis sp.]